MAHILVVDDEPTIVKLLTFNIEQEGHTVSSATNGTTALEIASEQAIDLIVLDLMLPGMTGIDVCKELRKQENYTPILMLTAKDGEYDKIIGLELGADDYMTKPFSPREVTARIKAILRRVEMSPTEARAGKTVETVIEIGTLRIDRERHTVYRAGEKLTLTPKEYELLCFLAENKGKVFGRHHLLDVIWDYDYAGETRIVDVHVSHLREKIEEDTKKPRYIVTVRGFGYKMDDVQ
ncbi:MULTISPECIES: response regulator transcription factor [Brochothrix]|uniref:DNA-binding response regulator n=1 Tax=Brochothrix thermosphacta TaxID=2756 RepID=A0A1D2KWI1_BROTH|nr:MULTISPECIES: response regulator transcription factor [Brochothrix]SLM91753.1 Alkaline phosphatase synthesis transcriptional regulatory protein PhoP [Brachybacterium faecium]ANZ94935.1 DNA-binding response regulator [Brochothrix thermosphacta]ANZ96764.1 DNA-binding response regulator [Brochothrix thermosphacta]ATF26176.1 DNA-binding response regulator [Brochothrix thermosphacta]ATH85515.1 DNA-binding response regulator [Brochothrix thermosphacta]